MAEQMQKSRTEDNRCGFLSVRRRLAIRYGEESVLCSTAL
jgi:hypothetical protein